MWNVDVPGCGKILLIFLTYIMHMATTGNMLTITLLAPECPDFHHYPQGLKYRAICIPGPEYGFPK